MQLYKFLNLPTMQQQSGDKSMCLLLPEPQSAARTKDQEVEICNTGCKNWQTFWMWDKSWVTKQNAG